jgi:hypothetical protein
MDDQETAADREALVINPSIGNALPDRSWIETYHDALEFFF